MSQALSANAIAAKFDLAQQAQSIGQHLSARGVSVSNSMSQGPSATLSQASNTTIGNIRPLPTPMMHQPQRGLSR